MQSARATIFCDVDEVVLNYFNVIENHIDPRYIQSVEGSGIEILDARTGEPLTQEHSDAVTDSVLSEFMSNQTLISGAKGALTRLSKRSEIVFITNVRPSLISSRKMRLKAFGLPFEVIPNKGGKGRIIRERIGSSKKRLIFVVDDSERQLKNVAQHVPSAHLMKARLTRTIKKTKNKSQFEVFFQWREIEAFLNAKIDQTV